MAFHPTVSGKRFNHRAHSRTTPFLRLASLSLLAVALLFVFYDFQVTRPPLEPLVPIDNSRVDPEFLDLPSVKNPPEVVPESDSPHVSAPFGRGLEVGADAREWTKEDGQRPIPLPPQGAPVKLPKHAVEPADPLQVRQSAWTPPKQPTSDTSRRITTEDLRSMFAILPTNRTLVDQRMLSRLEGYDIRNDDQFRELATQENLTDIHARYHGIERRGWGSLLPSGQSSVTTDHLYHVRHSGDAVKGYAVYASVDIPVNTVLGLYGGELVNGSEVRDGQYVWEAPAMTLYDPSTSTWKKYNMALDSSRVGNLLRFVNDLGNRRKNVDAMWVPIDNRWNLFYLTTRDISANEELSISYGDEYWRINSKSHTTEGQSHGEKFIELPRESQVAEGQHKVSGPVLEPGSDEASYAGSTNDISKSSMIQGKRLEGLTDSRLDSSSTGTDTQGESRHIEEYRNSSPRKLVLRKQYLDPQPQPQLSVGFVQPSAENHATGTRYA